MQLEGSNTVKKIPSATAATTRPAVDESTAGERAAPSTTEKP
jgi:hypothetical protein